MAHARIVVVDYKSLRKMASYGESFGKSVADNDTTESPAEDSSSCSSSVTSLIDHLRQAPKAAVKRKRKVAQNLPHDGRRNKSPSCSSDPKGVTVHQRVKEYPNEALVVSANKLFCTVCRKEVSLKKSVITLHIKSGKHSQGKVHLQTKHMRERDISEAMKKYGEETHPVGETLSTEQRVYRVKVVSTFLRAGVPMSKIDSFRELLEENSYRLAGRKPMSDLIPFVLGEEKQQVRQELNGKDVAVIFDGTCRLGEALVIVLRFVEDFTVCQRVVRMQLLAKSLKGEEIACELITVLSTELSIPSPKVLAGTHD